MDYRRLGKAGTRVSVISLGSWLTYGAGVEQRTAEECISTAVANGINFIDTADAYAAGEAERVVGQAIQDLTRSDLVISSKLYWPISENVNDRGLSRKHIMESIDKSLQRLGTDYLDIYFCHRYDPETPLEETVRAMSDLVHAGKIIYWGTSVWEAEQIEAAVRLAREYGGYPPQVEQPRYNLLDRHIEAQIMPTVDRHGIGLTVFSPLAQGILTGKYNQGVPEGSRATSSTGVQNQLTEANLTTARRLADVAQEHGLSLSQLALAWILRRPEVSSVIMGASKPSQVVDNVQAADVRLSPDVLAEIETILNQD